MLWKWDTHTPNNEVHITNCDQINHETFSECTNSHKSTRTTINRIRHVVFENKIIKLNEFNELQPLTFTWAVRLVWLSFLLLDFFFVRLFVILVCRLSFLFDSRVTAQYMIVTVPMASEIEAKTTEKKKTATPTTTTTEQAKRQREWFGI